MEQRPLLGARAELAHVEAALAHPLGDHAAMAVLNLLARAHQDRTDRRLSIASMTELASSTLYDDRRDTVRGDTADRLPLGKIRSSRSEGRRVSPTPLYLLYRCIDDLESLVLHINPSTAS